VRRRFTGVSRKRVLGLGFERGLHLEVAGVMGNPSRGSGGNRSGQRRRPAAKGCSGMTVRSREREKAEGKREKWLASILTPLRGSCDGLRRGRSGGAAVQRAAEARQWRAAEELGALGFSGGRQRLRLGELGHGA
jgi:hypothetical protein